MLELFFRLSAGADAKEGPNSANISSWLELRLCMTEAFFCGKSKLKVSGSMLFVLKGVEQKLSNPKSPV